MQLMKSSFTFIQVCVLCISSCCISDFRTSGRLEIRRRIKFGPSSEAPSPRCCSRGAISSRRRDKHQRLRLKEMCGNVRKCGGHEPGFGRSVNGGQSSGKSMKESSRPAERSGFAWVLHGFAVPAATLKRSEIRSDPDSSESRPIAPNPDSCR